MGNIKKPLQDWLQIIGIAVDILAKIATIILAIYTICKG